MDASPTDELDGRFPTRPLEVGLLLVFVGLLVAFLIATSSALAHIDPAVNTTVSTTTDSTLTVDVENPEGTVVFTGGWFGGEEYARITGDGTVTLSGLQKGETVNVLLYRDGDWGYVTSLSYPYKTVSGVEMSFTIQDKAFVCHPTALYSCVGELF